MLIKVTVDYLGGETIYFTVDRLLQLEQLTKKSTNRLVNDDFSLADLIHALVVGTRHTKLRDPVYFQTKIQAAMNEGKSFTEISEPVMKALIGSGVLGKKAVYAVFPEFAIDELENEVDERIEAKNENPTQEK